MPVEEYWFASKEHFETKNVESPSAHLPSCKHNAYISSSCLLSMVSRRKKMLNSFIKKKKCSTRQPLLSQVIKYQCRWVNQVIRIQMSGLMKNQFSRTQVMHLRSWLIVTLLIVITMIGLKIRSLEIAKAVGISQGNNNGDTLSFI